MKELTLGRVQLLEADLEQAFSFFSRAENPGAIADLTRTPAPV